MLIIYELAALAEMSLIVVEHSGYLHLRGLPLGGGQIQQIGLLFATAHVVAKLTELFRKPRRKGG